MRGYISFVALPLVMLAMQLSGCALQQTSSTRAAPEQAQAEIVAPRIPERFLISGGIGVLQDGDGWHGKMNWRQNQSDSADQGRRRAVPE